LLSPLAAFILLRTAPVQTYLAHRFASYLSNELQTEVSIGNFRLSWFLDVVITDVRIIDKHQKVLLEAKKIRADVISIDIQGRKLSLDEISLTNSDVNLIYYTTDSCLNLQFIIDQFSTTKVTDTSRVAPWKLHCKNIKLNNSHFAYRDERYMEPTKGIDFSDMDFSSLNLELHDILFHGDSITADIAQFTCKEKSGLILNDFTTNATICPRGLNAKSLQITTEKSRISMDLKFEYNNWNAYNYFIDSVRINAFISPSQLDMRDIVSFAPEVEGMTEIFDFSGNIRGTVSSFSARNFQLMFANHTSFRGNVVLNGLPNVEETFINLKIDEFYTDVADIQSFTIPYSSNRNSFLLPEEIKRLGNISVNGRFTGFYNDFVSKATFITDAGQITTDILLSRNKATRDNEYNGRVLVESFDVGKVFNAKQFGTLSLYATVKGRNFSLDKADLTAKGEITDLQYEGNTIGLINVDGVFTKKRFTGGVYINDELLGLDFIGSADFSEDLPAFDFQADIVNANLVKLNLLSNDSTVLLSTSTNFKFKGNSIDNLIGTLRFSNTNYSEGSESLMMKNLSVSTSLISNGGKRMQLNSDFANAVFSGQYNFDDMAEYLTMVFTDFLPSLSNTQSQPTRINKGSFDYTINLHHTDSLTRMFLPWLKINPNTVISGTFDPLLGLVNVNGRSPMIVLNGFALHNWSLTGSSVNKSLNVRMECDEINMSESPVRDTNGIRIEKFKLQATAADDSVQFAVLWNDNKLSHHNKGSILGAVSFKEAPRLSVRFDNAEIMINDTVWTNIPGSFAVIDTSYINIHNIGFTNKDKHIILNGTVSNDPLSQMVLDIKDFNISQADILTNQLGFDMDGFVDGKITISELYAIPRITADVGISKFGFNHENLGDAEIISQYDNEKKCIGVNMRVVYVGNVGTHYPIKVLGNIYPENKHDNFDLNIDVDNLKLRTFEPFLEGIFSRVKGYASGTVTLTGDFADPVLKGKVNLMRSEMLIDYLRTSYSFTGDFNFDKDLMWFKDLQITDSTANKGIVTGYIKHKAFADWALDISLKADNLTALNTPFNPNEMYYGRAKVSGTMTINGPVENLVLKANVKSDKGTKIVIPISFSRSISENDFIKYRNLKIAANENEVVKPEESSIFALQLGLDVTRNADIGIILPYQMGTIDVKGDGIINMGIDSRGDYSMYGQYVMDNGNFMFNFENILKKNFQIQKGGTIIFNGSPYEADINLQAIYKLKTSLVGLPSIPESYKGARVNVNCIVNLSNNLYNPDIKFTIALPDAADEVKRSVFSSIDTTNALEMNQQMISLLVLNSFSSTSGISSSGALSGLSSYEILSSQLSRMLSQISKDFDIGVNYRPGDQLSPQELELALSTQLFDNRVTIDGAVGTNTYNNTNQTTQIIGDVMVDVKITEDGRLRLKAFNRTNSTFDVLSGYSPYTQGVGVLFRKDFNYFNELFKKKKKAILPAKTPSLIN